jgi:HAD superfamily hydrolase (TIGR01549 family)
MGNDTEHQRVPSGSPKADCHAAWLVDLDGTLYSAPPVRMCMLGELSLGGWRAIPTLRRFRLEQEHLRRGQTEPSDPFQTQIERTARARGVTTDEVEHLVREWMLERPAKWLRFFRHSALLEELVAFRRGGGRLALVSDYPARRKLAALGCGELFDAVVASGEAGGPRWLKPHPDGLLTAAEQLGVSPSRCLVLGDRLDVDGEAARRAGMSFRHVT